jgi:aminotransferase EvaB
MHNSKSEQALSWRVPYNYLEQQFGNREDIFEAWRSLAKSSDFTLGKYVDNFEKEFSSYIGMEYCIGTNNGTQALILGMKALGIGPGDEVITVPNSFYATTGAIVAVGATPKFIDVDDRYQMNPQGIEEAVTKKTKAVLPVYWGGAAPDLTSIYQIAESAGLAVIEDACMAIGGKYKTPKRLQSSILAFSMHPLKSLNVMGDGGMVATNDKESYEWMKKYRNHGMVDRDHIDFWGENIRLQPFQAVVASIELEKLDEIIKMRNKNAMYLDGKLKGLSPNVIVPERTNLEIETYSLYIVQVAQRDELLSFLHSSGIDAKIHYPVPLHLQKAGRALGYSEGDFPNSENQAESIITLPAHQYLNIDQLEFMAIKIEEFYTQNS